MSLEGQLNKLTKNPYHQGDHDPRHETAGLPEDGATEEQEIEGHVEAAGAEGDEGQVRRQPLRVVQKLEDGQPEMKCLSG